MPRLVFDLETDGLLDQVTKIHCAVLVDVDTGAVRSFTDASDAYEPVSAFLEEYQNPDNLMIGHNAINYDCPVLDKLKGLSIQKPRVRDTMVMGRVIFPDIKQTDFDRNRRWKAYLDCTEKGLDWAAVSLRDFDKVLPVPLEFPGQHIGAHSLAAWGFRIGEHKGDYTDWCKAQGIEPWAKWRPEMHDYMIQDGLTTAELYRRFDKRDLDPRCLELEHRIAWLCAQIERNGFPFDVDAAVKLLGRLVDEKEALRRELIGLFPNWRERLPDFIPKRNNKTKGYIAGEPVERWKEHEFNPQSRAHIINRFRDKYSWAPNPDEYTQKPETDPVTGEKIPQGSPKMDEDVLAKLPYPEATKLARLFLLNKRIGQLSEGNQAWLKVQREGKIHARYNTNGAVTGRATHSRPNISQVPRVSSEFGRDCRALFTVPPGWVLIGADQSGLELRCLASDMCSFDNGQYITAVTEGDVHTVNQQAAELDTRDKAKTFIYAFLYGAGDAKIGTIVAATANFFKQKKLGKALKTKFLKGLPGLGALLNVVKKKAATGSIKGIDGRIMPIRSPHAALNTRLQNSGAVICKRWGADAEDQMLARGLKHGWDGDFAFVSWSHDEYQVAARDNPETIQAVRECLVETGRRAGDPYNFRCPLEVETKVGANWSLTH